MPIEGREGMEEGTEGRSEVGVQRKVWEGGNQLRRYEKWEGGRGVDVIATRRASSQLPPRPKVPHHGSHKIRHVIPQRVNQRVNQLVAHVIALCQVPDTAIAVVRRLAHAVPLHGFI